MRGTRDGQVCPYRIVDDIGSGFQIGMLGGSIFYFIRERFMGGINLIKKRGPMLGGSFCAWMGLFGTFQCVMLYLRGKDTHMNQTIAGGLTGATINIRGGWRYALRGGVSGAVFIGIFNVIEIFMMKSQYKMMLNNKKLQDEYGMYKELENVKKVQPKAILMSQEELTYERRRLERELSAAMGVDVGMMP